MPALRSPRHPSTSRLTSKGQVTIPAHIRKFLGVTPHDRVTFLVRDGRVELLREQSIAATTAGMMKSKVGPLSPQEENAIFEQAMAEDADRLPD
jgi:AbrB family looped-hinge helix DNA binding protein